MRQEKIVEYLYLKKEVIDPKTLSDKFEISVRTLSNDIKILKDYGPSQGFTVETIRSKGYQLRILDEVKFKEYFSWRLEERTINNTNRQERIKNIELLLLFNNNYITMQEIAEWLDVSLSTIKLDMSQVEFFCKNYELILHGKTYHGVKIIGSESKKRRAILYLIRNTIDTPVLTNKYKEFNFTFDDNDLRIFLQDQFNKNKIKISDIIFENIIQHIRLLSFRIIQNNTLTNEDDMMIEVETDQKQLTLELVNYLENRYSFKISTFEKKYLEEQLHGKLVVLDDMDSNFQLKKIIENAIEIIDKKFYTNFSNDQDLINALLMHVSPLLQRLYAGHQLDNPLINDIYTQYANVFNIAMIFINELNKGLEKEISKDEIGYIAIYFAASLEKQSYQIKDNYRKIAVVCSTGGGASYLLKVNLERIFNNAEVKTYALNEIGQITSDVELIISSVIINDGIIDKPIIYTKTILNQAEIGKIEKSLSLIRGSAFKEMNINEFILNLFNKDYFQIDDEKRNYIEVLEKQSERMEIEHWADKGYKNSVLSREKMIDTIYQHGVAGPHPMEQSAIKEVINVIIFQKPIFYNQKKVKIIFLINIKKDHLDLHKEISRLMIKMMEDVNLDKQLEKITNFQEFILYMKNLLRER